MRKRLEALLKRGKDYIIESPEGNLEFKPSPDKWSKKEILGHLIDSGINNLQRFTEIRFTEKPYSIRKYNQDELVKANDYQNADISKLLDFWLAVNYRIMDVLGLQDKETLSYAIKFENGETSDLKFLAEDYIDHMEHHLDQIMSA